MLTNYIKIAIRNTKKNKLYSIINIMGLSMGMACAILLFLFVQDELSYDRHHSKHERIYMVQSQFRFGDRDVFDIGSYFAIGPTLKDEYPVIEESVRLFSSDRIYFTDKKKGLIGEDNIRYADPEIFKVFDHKFIFGSSKGALDNPKSIVLCKSLAQKYFGDENPVGKILSTNNNIDYIVTGVFENLPHNSFIQYNALLPMMDLTGILGEETLNSRKSCSFFSSAGRHVTFILLKENTKIENISNDFERFKEKYLAECGQELNASFKPVFQLLSDVYLHYSMNGIPVVLLRLYSIGSLAFLILLLACINYMNLATAKATDRAREVGVRKVLGANRASLIRQFLSESIVIAIIGLLLALLLVELFLPAFNNLADKEISFSLLAKPDMFAGLFIITLLVGLIAGSYPAFLLSSYIPVKVLKGEFYSGKNRGILRKILVIVQFMISIVVIIDTMTIHEQMHFIQHMDLGFHKDNIMQVSPTGPEATKSILALNKEIIKNKDVKAIARSFPAFGAGLWNTAFEIEDPKGSLIDKLFTFLYVDFDFINLMEIQVIKGRSFNREMITDQTEAFLVNDALVKEMGWTDSPIGKRIKMANGFNSRDGKVIGVLKDFHFQSLREKIKPIAISLQKEDEMDRLMTTYIKMSSSKSKETFNFIKEKWEEICPSYPFEYSMLEDIIENQYINENRVFKVIDYSAFLCIFVSCLGLFGLSSFIAEKQKKEIGIRKAHGASVWNIYYHMAIKYIKLILISGILAWPISNLLIILPKIYAYTPKHNPWLIVYAVCISLLIALLMISYHAIKSAYADPVKTLRYE
jgi:putative ABC transport system permease protein